MYSPAAPHRVQDGGVCRWEWLVLPRSVVLDKTVLANHLDNDELPCKTLKNSSYQDEHSVVYI
jgi:hypothetical protein